MHLHAKTVLQNLYVFLVRLKRITQVVSSVTVAVMIGLKVDG
jgi:hypothetical protein